MADVIGGMRCRENSHEWVAGFPWIICVRPRAVDVDLDIFDILDAGLAVARRGLERRLFFCVMPSLYRALFGK